MSLRQQQGNLYPAYSLLSTELVRAITIPYREQPRMSGVCGSSPWTVMIPMRYALNVTVLTPGSDTEDRM
jgi:hypothetical protein